MKKIMLLGALVLILLLAVGCNSVEENGVENEPFEFDYELLEEDDLVEEAAKEWYQENKEDYGFYIYDVNETEKYLLVSAGERRTGGYALNIIEANASDLIVSFEIALEEPSSDDMVTQALTYPSLLVRVTANEGFDVDANLNFEAEESKDLENYEMKFENIEGIYVGQIDNNFIEIDLSKNAEFRQRANIEEDFVSLMVKEEIKEEIELLESGNPVIFNCYQNENNTWIIENIKINEDI